MSCFNSGLFINQVTNVLAEMVPYCKSCYKYSCIYQAKIGVSDTNIVQASCVQTVYL